MASTLKELKAELEAKKADIEQAIAPLRQKAHEIQVTMQPLEDGLRAIHKEIKKAEAASGLRDISMEIAACARASKGNRTLVNEGAAKPAPKAEA